MSEKKPYLVEIGANTRNAPGSINLDVSGTVGPDYLGQETVDVSGHPCDRPGVLYRLPENAGTFTDMDGYEHVHPGVDRMDTGEELPVLLSSNMRADPCEGVQGSYTQIQEGECARCGYDRLRVSVHTMAGEARETCNACGAIQDRRADHGYSMPKLDTERAQEERDSGELLVKLRNKKVYDMEHTTGYGPYLSLVGSKDITRIRKDEIVQIFCELWMEGDIDFDVIHNYIGASNHRTMINELVKAL